MNAGEPDVFFFLRHLERQLFRLFCFRFGFRVWRLEIDKPLKNRVRDDLL